MCTQCASHITSNNISEERNKTWCKIIYMCDYQIAYIHQNEITQGKNYWCTVLSYMEPWAFPDYDNDGSSCVQTVISGLCKTKSNLRLKSWALRMCSVRVQLWKRIIIPQSQDFFWVLIWFLKRRHQLIM